MQSKASLGTILLQSHDRKGVFVIRLNLISLISDQSCKKISSKFFHRHRRRLVRPCCPSSVYSDISSRCFLFVFGQPATYHRAIGYWAISPQRRTSLPNRRRFSIPCNSYRRQPITCRSHTQHGTKQHHNL